MTYNKVIGIIFGLLALAMAAMLFHMVLFDDPKDYKIFELLVMLILCFIASKINDRQTTKLR